MSHVTRAIPRILLVGLLTTTAARSEEIAPVVSRPTAILSAIGYEGFLAELRAADAVVTLKVLSEHDPVPDLATNSLVSLELRAEVTEVFKGEAHKGDVLEVCVPYAALGQHPSRGLGWFALVPKAGEEGTFLLARDRTWRATNLVTPQARAEDLRTYVAAAEARGEEAALQLAELFCRTSFQMLRDKGPPYGFSRTLVEDVKLHYGDLDPGSGAFQRRLVDRYTVDVLRQCERPTLMTNGEGWDAVVWLAACMDDAGRRKAVGNLLEAYDASVERVRKLPPRTPITRTPGPLACASAPDPHDTEASVQTFLLGAMQLIMEPAWVIGPPGDALGHLVPHERLTGAKLQPGVVLAAARKVVGN